MRVSESQRLARGSARQAPGDAHCLLLLQSRTKLGWGRGRQEAGGTGKREGHPRLSVLRPRPRPQAWGSRAGPRPLPPEANLPDPLWGPLLRGAHSCRGQGWSGNHLDRVRRVETKTLCPSAWPLPSPGPCRVPATPEISRLSACPDLS